MRIGMLTSGGDCPGLNAAIRGVAKSVYEHIENVEIIGIANGYSGLITGETRNLKKEDFSGILTLGGTLLGTARTPFKNMLKIENDNVDKVKNMVENYEKLKLDCLLTLGGNGTHKTAHLLCKEGLNIIGLPKTIDNDIWGTDVTFGFHTAVDIDTEVIDRIHTTAASHGRVMIIELMGNKAGWLTLYSGVAGGADIIIIPEIPYDRKIVLDAVQRRADNGKAFSIIAVAEGARRLDEANLKRKALAEKRAEEGYISVSNRLANAIESVLGIETRVTVPGHIQRGGSPSAYDRILATKFGARAAELISEKKFGYTVALVDNKLKDNPLSEVAGKTKTVPLNDQVIRLAKKMGVSFGV